MEECLENAWKSEQRQRVSRVSQKTDLHLQGRSRNYWCRLWTWALQGDRNMV